MREEMDKLQKEREKSFNLLLFAIIAFTGGFFGGCFYLASSFISQCTK